MRIYIVVVCSLLFFSPRLKAGDGDCYVSLSGGWLYCNAMSYGLTFEQTRRYHNAWELGLDYYHPLFSPPNDRSGRAVNHDALLFEGAYKINMVRYKNANLRFRAAVGAGVNGREQFTLSLSPGFEYTYTCPSNIQLFVQEKTQFSFWTTNHSWFRAGFLVGIKIPLQFN